MLCSKAPHAAPAPRRLQTACERAKRTLSSSTQTSVEIDSLYEARTCFYVSACFHGVLCGLWLVYQCRRKSSVIHISCVHGLEHVHLVRQPHALKLSNAMSCMYAAQVDMDAS